MATRLIGVEISTNDDLLIKLRFHGGWAGTDRAHEEAFTNQAGRHAIHTRSPSKQIVIWGDYTRIIISLRKESVSNLVLYSPW